MHRLDRCCKRRARNQLHSWGFCLSSIPLKDASLPDLANEMYRLHSLGSLWRLLVGQAASHHELQIPVLAAANLVRALPAYGRVCFATILS